MKRKEKTLSTKLFSCTELVRQFSQSFNTLAGGRRQAGRAAEAETEVAEEVPAGGGRGGEAVRIVHTRAEGGRERKKGKPRIRQESAYEKERWR